MSINKANPDKIIVNGVYKIIRPIQEPINRFNQISLAVYVELGY